MHAKPTNRICGEGRGHDVARHHTLEVSKYMERLRAADVDRSDLQPHGRRQSGGGMERQRNTERRRASYFLLAERGRLRYV